MIKPSSTAAQVRHLSLPNNAAGGGGGGGLLLLLLQRDNSRADTANKNAYIGDERE